MRGYGGCAIVRAIEVGGQHALGITRFEGKEKREMKTPIGVGVLSFAHGHVGGYANVMKDFDDVRAPAIHSASEKSDPRRRNSSLAQQ